VVGVELERGEEAVGGQGAGHRDGRVAEGAELEDPAGVDRAAEDLQQSRLGRGDLDLRGARAGGGGWGTLERLVGAGEQRRLNEGIDRAVGILCGPLRHAPPPDMAALTGGRA
jgi:hypothetical protein